MPHRSRRCAGCFLLLLLSVGAAQIGAAEAPKEPMPRLTYAQLAQLVHDNQGKVVYVDFWNFGCVACKTSMPNLARLQEKYGPSGFVSIVVDCDDPNKPEERQKAIEFISRENLHLNILTHCQLNETPEAIRSLLDLKVFPRGYLFDRSGRMVHRSDEAARYEPLAKEIEEQLEKK